MRNLNDRRLSIGPLTPGPSLTAKGEGRKCVWRRPPVSGFLGPGVLVARAELTNPWVRASRPCGSWRWVRVEGGPWTVRREALFHVKQSAGSSELQGTSQWRERSWYSVEKVSVRSPSCRALTPVPVPESCAAGEGRFVVEVSTSASLLNLVVGHKFPNRFRVLA